jgi:hypothetical protein
VRPYLRDTGSCPVRRSEEASRERNGRHRDAILLANMLRRPWPGRTWKWAVWPRPLRWWGRWLRARATGNRQALVDALRVQAMVATRQGRREDAERALKGGLSLARRIPYP